MALKKLQRGWQIDYRDPTGKRVRQSFPTKKEAQAELAKRISLKAEGRYLDVKDENARRQNTPTLRQYAEQWLATYVAGSLKPKTQEGYHATLKAHVLPAFGHKRLDEVTRVDIKDLIFAKQAAGLSANTIRLIRAPLSRLLTHAMDDGLIAANPCSRVGHYIKSNGREKEPEPFTPEEGEVFLAAVRKHFPQHYALFLCYLRTGMRPSEALALQWEDIDLRGRFIEVRRNISAGHVLTTKTGKGRRVDMSRQLAEALEAHRTTQKKAILKWRWAEMPAWVFTSEAGGLIELHNLRQRVFYRALDKAGLRRRGLHSLRHTYATLRIGAGHSIEDVSKQLGHASIKMTVDVYYKWLPGSRKAEVDELDHLVALTAQKLTARGK